MQFTIICYFSVFLLVYVCVETVSISSNVQLIYQNDDNSTSDNAAERFGSQVKDEKEILTNDKVGAVVLTEDVKENDDNVDETSGEVDDKLDTDDNKSDLKNKATGGQSNVLNDSKVESILNDNEGSSIKETPADIGGMMKGILQRLDDIISLGKCNAEKAESSYPLPSCPNKAALSQPIITDSICNEISKLEVKIQSVADAMDNMAKTQNAAALKSEKAQSSESKGDKHNYDDGVIASLKNDIAKLSRSFALSASRQGHVPSDVTRSRLTGFTARINDDSSFNTGSGILTVPARGLYMFTLSYHKRPLGAMKAFLVADRETIATGNDNKESTLTALVELRQGHEVWVEVSTSGVPGDDVTFTLTAFLVR